MQKLAPIVLGVGGGTGLCVNFSPNFFPNFQPSTSYQKPTFPSTQEQATFLFPNLKPSTSYQKTTSPYTRTGNVSFSKFETNMFMKGV
jgi:hypothetical protein